MSTVKAVSMSEVRTAKDGRQYFVATFRPGFGQNLVNRTFWEQFKTVAGIKTQTKFWDKGSPSEMASLIVSGEAIEGKRVTHNVETYEIAGRLVSTYSTIVFPGEVEINLFAGQNHPIISEHGEVLGKRVKAIVNIAPTEKVEKALETKAEVETTTEAIA